MLGYHHHRRYVRDRPKSRRWFTHMHVWLGRLLILAGLANCGTGLLLANVARTGVIAWYVVFGVLAGAYAVVVLTIRGYPKKSRENEF
jgi:hypothetical protein